MKRIDELQSYLVEKNFSQLFLLTDDNVSGLCMPVLLEKVDEITDRQAVLLEIPASSHNSTDEIKPETKECESKNTETALNIINSLAESNADRDSCLISLGGGAVTDLGGFVSSVYKRGIQNVNVPTTLLGMVDAAIGGKTAVNHGGIKNLIGTFNFQSEVFIDTEFLSTLPNEGIKDGLAEMIKTFAVSDKEMFDCLAAKMQNDDLNNKNITDISPMIFKCSRIKERITEQDPYDRSVRKSLNFGHTLGHAVEMYYGLSHGHGVAVGMHYAADLSVKYCGLNNATATRIKRLMETNYSIPDYATDMPHLIELMQHDKKNNGRNINFVLLKDIAEPCLCPIEMQ